MPHILAIDPGNVQSAWALIDAEDCMPVYVGKDDNRHVRNVLHDHGSYSTVAIEMVASYGMAVGATVFETCVEIGRFVEIAPTARLIYRKDVKLHLCGQARAKDGNIRQALIDRFGVKGTKKAPGWFYGFAADTWQAYAVAVYVADTLGAAQGGRTLAAATV